MRRAARFLRDTIWTLWFGGLSFYMIVVVPIGGRVLGAESQGFVTSEVTWYVNLFGMVSAATLGFEATVRHERLRLCACIVLALVTLVLIWLRSEMMPMLDGNRAEIRWQGLDFYSVHRLYLWITTIQWLSGLVLLWNQTKMDRPSHSPDGPAPKSGQS